MYKFRHNNYMVARDDSVVPGPEAMARRITQRRETAQVMQLVNFLALSVPSQMV